MRTKKIVATSIDKKVIKVVKELAETNEISYSQMTENLLKIGLMQLNKKWN